MKTKNLLTYPTIHPNEPEFNLNLQSILEECMGNIQLLQELISLFHRNALEFIGASKIHLSDTNFKALGLAAHKVKSGLAMMKSDSLHTIVELIMKECDGNRDAKHLQFLCNSFSTEYPLVKREIDRAMTQLNR